MSYLVLARKYRPQNFDELIGQEILVRTLTNAIRNNRLHHAYILTGIRGVGKTTTARIIAKTLNCLNNDAIEKAKACGECDNCKSIATSRHQDVIEIDAASRTGIDDMREIIDSIAYAPVSAKYKIYIIDEVHMLSNSAFNALLKTLEEPPSHVKFVFATTEIRKVPITILSRCQRFDLRRLDELEIASHLKKILQQESLDADDQALALISRCSEGSVRDSLSLLDQALASNNHQKFLSAELVEKMLGLSDPSQIIELFEKILSGDFSSCTKTFTELYSYSSDISQLLQDLLDVTHKAASLKLIKDYKIAGYSEYQKQKIAAIAEKISLNSLNRIWQMLMKGTSEINFAISPKMTFEMLLVRMCHLTALPDLQQVLLNLNENKNFPKDRLESEQETNREKNLAQKTTENNDDLMSEIMHNFEGAKLI